VVVLSAVVKSDFQVVLPPPLSGSVMFIGIEVLQNVVPRKNFIDERFEEKLSAF
jgi:hypothetical protein